LKLLVNHYGRVLEPHTLGYPHAFVEAVVTIIDGHDTRKEARCPTDAPDHVETIDVTWADPVHVHRLQMHPAVRRRSGHHRARPHSGPAGLSPREIEVLRLVARGLSSREIAEQVTLSTNTVRNHKERIYAKTGTGNRVAASLFALHHGLLPID
jgi:DNA-binding CsgD family transcriptional regulator